MDEKETNDASRSFQVVYTETGQTELGFVLMSDVATGDEANQHLLNLKD